MLKLADLRKTTRRSNVDGLRNVHPRFLRDRSLAPRIDMAIRYLESMLGRPRRDLDQEVIVQLFGDHKLARCVIACLASSYRHRTRTFEEALPPEHYAALAQCGPLTPSDLRLWLFRRANRELPGFVGAGERPAFMAEAAAELGIKPSQLDMLMSLDQPANAVLTRSGPRPTSDDVIARFNYETVAALLANASLVRVSLAHASASAETVRALCEQAGVTAELAGRELVLHGRQDAMNGWARNGARLVRLLSTLLCCGLPARSGEALVAAPGGGEWRFRLDDMALADLGAPPEPPAAAFCLEDVLACWRRADSFAADFGALRRAGGADGWTLRRAAEPVVLAGAALPALFIAMRGTQRVPIVVAPVLAGSGNSLPTSVARLPLVALALAQHVADETGAPAAATSDLPTLRYHQRGDIAALLSLLARAVGDAEQRSDLARVEAIVAEACEAGVLTEAQLAQRLGCSEEDVWALLALPAACAARESSGLRYIEGFGLCTADVLTRAQAVAADVEMHSQPAAEPLRKVRALGRRLREVTGTTEGIECLIAYLEAA
jgi:Protein of unknown function (DUF790)